MWVVGPNSAVSHRSEISLSVTKKGRFFLFFLLFFCCTAQFYFSINRNDVFPVIIRGILSRNQACRLLHRLQTSSYNVQLPTTYYQLVHINIQVYISLFRNTAQTTPACARTTLETPQNMYKNKLIGSIVMLSDCSRHFMSC